MRQIFAGKAEKKNNTPYREQTKCKKIRCPVLPILAGHEIQEQTKGKRTAISALAL